MVKQLILTIIGSTTSGKTSLTIELAKRTDGEIIGLESRQIYEGMPIGTAQPTDDESPHGRQTDHNDPCHNDQFGHPWQRRQIAIPDCSLRGRMGHGDIMSLSDNPNENRHRRDVSPGRYPGQHR